MKTSMQFILVILWTAAMLALGAALYDNSLRSNYERTGIVECQGWSVTNK